MQAPGESFKAESVVYQADEHEAHLSLDIASAYPPEAKLKSWQREVCLKRGQAVTFSDIYELSEAVKDLSLSLLTPCQIDLSTPGLIVLRPRDLLDGRQAGQANIYYPGSLFEASIEEIPITDERLGGTWGTLLYRISLQAQNPPVSGQWTIEVRAA